jgi:predicted MFS family arabinose efflux permease
MGVGGSVGLLAEGYIINAFGWRVAFFTMAAIGLLTLVLPQSTRVLVNYSWKPK